MYKPDRRDFLRLGLLGAVPLATGCPNPRPVDPTQVDHPDLPPGWPSTQLGTGPSTPISHHPWMQMVQGGVRIRIATLDMQPAQLTLDGAVIELTTSEQTITHTSGSGELMDAPGLHVIYEAFIPMEPGDRRLWTFQVAEESFQGVCHVPALDQPFRVGYIADTHRSVSDSLFFQMGSMEVDLILHGGDLEYGGATDSWKAMSAALGPSTERAPIHLARGNHESDSSVELEEMFVRLMGGAGDSRLEHNHAFSFSGRRFIFLDSESSEFTEPDSPLFDWLRQELEAHTGAVVVFHRPAFTYSHYYQNDTTARDAMHQLFVQSQVALVLNGHTHGYERFDVDGVVYLVDGGGGAFPYDLHGYQGRVEELRPGEGSLRQAHRDGYGCTILDFFPQGDIEGFCINEQGDIADQFVING